MMKTVLKVVEEIRFEIESDMDAYETECRQDAAAKGYDIAGFNKTHKVTKDDEFYIGKVTRVFNKANDILIPVVGVDYEYNRNVESNLEEF